MMDKEVDYKKETPLLTKYPQQEDMERGEEVHHQSLKEVGNIFVRPEQISCLQPIRDNYREWEEDNTTTKDDKPVLTVWEICAGGFLWAVITLTLTYAHSIHLQPASAEFNPCSPDAFKEVFGNNTQVNFLDVQLMHTNNDVLHVFATVDNYAQCKYIRQCLKLGNYPFKTFFPVACRVDNSRPVLGMIDFPDTSVYEIYD